MGTYRTSVNPYYNYDTFGWTLYCLDENLSYEFNTLAFWITKDGRVFTASDSGCSCPTPFEDYEGYTAEEVEQKLEQVGSIEQADRIFESWNQPYGDKRIVSQDEWDVIRRELKKTLDKEGN